MPKIAAHPALQAAAGGVLFCFFACYLVEYMNTFQYAYRAGLEQIMRYI